MKTDQIADLTVILKEGCAVALACCGLLILVGCGGTESDVANSGGSKQSDSNPPEVDIVPSETETESDSEPDSTAGQPPQEPLDAEIPGESNDGDSAPSTSEVPASEPETPDTTNSVEPVPEAIPEVAKTPKLRPRIKSPIDKLPPPEPEMTPPPPRNSIAAAELASEKSEEAGKAYMAFIEAKTTAERIKYIRGGEALKSKVEEYHTTHVQSDFKVTETQIMGSGRRLDDPTKFVFPYYVATTKNPFGFLVLVYEEKNGMKVSWEQFVLGQDYPMQDFLLRKDTEPYEFLGAITRAHIFDPDLSTAEKAKLLAVTIDLPRVSLADKPVAYVDIDSKIGKQLAEALPWGKRQLSRIGLNHDAKEKLRITSYAKLAHPN